MVFVDARLKLVSFNHRTLTISAPSLVLSNGLGGRVTLRVPTNLEEFFAKPGEVEREPGAITLELDADDLEAALRCVKSAR